MNFSATSLAEPTLAATVRQVLAMTACSPRQLIMEISGTTLVNDLVCADETIRTLENLGKCLAVDDSARVTAHELSATAFLWGSAGLADALWIVSAAPLKTKLPFRSL